MTTRYFEDISTEEARICGSRVVTREEILDFAEQYDPQEFHVDEEAAADSQLGGLVASGWHTAAVSMRLLVDGYLSEVAVVGALGVDRLRWRHPVRPGDELTVDVSPLRKEPWDDRNGKVDFSVTATNQRDEEVLSRTDLVLIERRETAK